MEKTTTTQRLQTYYNKYPKVLLPFQQFGIGCPPRLRVNAYKGCPFQCQFCYVPAKAEPYEGDIVKDLERDIRLATQCGLNALPVMGSCSTDPFQPLEEEFRYTKRVLQKLVDERFSLIIMTQNPEMLLLDEYLSIVRNAKAVVEVTIPSMSAGPEANNIFHTKAPRAYNRLQAMSKLIDNNIPVRLRLDPIVPRLDGAGSVQSQDDINEMVHQFQKIMLCAKENIKGQMLVISKVMELSEQMKVYNQYKDFYMQHGEKHVRDDGLEMLMLRHELQEKLLKPVYTACRERGIFFCQCVAPVYFMDSHHCTFPPPITSHELEKSTEKTNIDTVTDFLEHNADHFIKLVRKVFRSEIKSSKGAQELGNEQKTEETQKTNRSEFWRLLVRRNLEEFFRNKHFVESILGDMGFSPIEPVPKCEDPYKSLMRREPAYPVLYSLFERLIKTIEGSTSDKVKPKLIWAAANFWDPLSRSHLGEQFLNDKYFKPGDRILFDEIIRDWFLKPEARSSTVTITDLFLKHPSERRMIIIHKDRTDSGINLDVPKMSSADRDSCKILKLEGYESLLSELKKISPRYSIRNRIRNGETINDIMKDYLSRVPFDNEVINKLAQKLLQALNVKQSVDDTKKLLNTLLVFDLVTPNEWKFLVVYPCLLYTDNPIGGVFLVLEKLLTPSESIFLQLMTSQAMAVPEILINQYKFLERSLRSAIAAIMARNKAHIFSSQVLVRFKNNEITSILIDYIITRDEYLADVTGIIPLLWGEGIPERVFSTSGGNEAVGIIEDYRHTKVLNKLAEASAKKIAKVNITVTDLEERIGLPYGSAVGRHAVYNIIENYIRNVSKYGHLIHNGDEILQVQLSRSNDNKHSVLVKLTSNSKISSETQKYAEVANKLWNYYKAPVIDNEGRWPTKGLGIAEMKIHAGILAGADPHNLVSEDGVPFFIFDKDAAEKDGEYTFYFLLRKYVETYYLENEDNFDKFVNQPGEFPLCDFLVIANNGSQRYSRDNWYKFPLRTLASSQRLDGWLAKQVIPLNLPANAEVADFHTLFWKRLKEFGAIDYCVKVFDDTPYNNVEEKRIIEGSTGKFKLGLYHQSSNRMKDIAETWGNDRIFPFAHKGATMVWLSELNDHSKETNGGGYSADLIRDMKWKILLGSMIVIIDSRIYKDLQHPDLSETKNDLNRMGTHVLPESIDITNNLTIVHGGNTIGLSDFQFLSVHYGYLEEKLDSLLRSENHLSHLPPFLFMHTGRGKIDEDFFRDYYWFRRVLSLGAVTSAFRADTALEIKIRLMEVFLSSQQGSQM